MVKVGFIVEGVSDFIILKENPNISMVFRKYNIAFDEELVRIARSKSKLKENFVSLYKSLIKFNPICILILVDQDDKEQQRKNKKYKPHDCPIDVVSEIQKYRDNKNYIKSDQVYIVMVREMEAWFLADPNLRFDCKGRQPEEILNPSEVVGEQLDTTCHVKIANRVKDKFSLERAAENAPSAKRFLDKLINISQQ